MNQLTFLKAADFIRKSSSCVVLSGAGMSVAAGIPDFRSEKGLYNMARDQGYDPNHLFDIKVFKKNPKIFYSFAKHVIVDDIKPTTAHHFVKQLDDKHKLLRNYTQNIDMLEIAAGVPDERLVFAHGTTRTGSCISCDTKYLHKDIMPFIRKGEVFSCTKCDEPVKPDVVFFGERLPDRYRKLIDSDLNQCDLLIVLGTSLRVYPIASIIEHIKSSIPVIIMNFHLPSGINLANPHVFLSGDIQETSHILKKMI